MSKLKLTGKYAYTDQYGRGIFVLDDDSGAKVAQFGAKPAEFPVRSKLPLDPAGLGHTHELVVAPRRFKITSSLAHNAGEIVSGVYFNLISIKNI